MRTGAAGQWAQAARWVGVQAQLPWSPPQAACGPEMLIVPGRTGSASLPLTLSSRVSPPDF